RARTHRTLARPCRADVFKPERLRHKPGPAEDRKGNGAEALRTPRRDFSESEVVRARSGAVRQTRQAWARSGVGVFARTLLQGFCARGRETLRCGQAKTEENQCRASNIANAV